jgi:hypothetical protein
MTRPDSDSSGNFNVAKILPATNSGNNLPRAVPSTSTQVSALATGS